MRLVSICTTVGTEAAATSRNTCCKASAASIVSGPEETVRVKGESAASATRAGGAASRAAGWPSSTAEQAANSALRIATGATRRTERPIDR